MRQFSTVATLEPCEIISTDPKRFTAKVRGKRNIGEIETTWLAYNCPGNFPTEDAHWEGRIPEKGTLVLVMAEWTDDHLKQLIRAYIIGYLPPMGLDYTKEGYGSYRDNSSGETAVGDHVTSTSARSFYKLSATGNIIEECTPANYRKRSPERNTVYEVCENRHTHISGYVERVTHDEYGNRQNKYVRVLWSKLPVSGEFNTEAQRMAALSDAGNVVILEEMGANIALDFVVPSAPTVTNPVYKFTVINSGQAVYSKVIDANGNIFEGNTGNRAMTVSQNLTIYVSETFHTVARFISWAFGAASTAASGLGAGIWDFVATRVNFRRG